MSLCALLIYTITKLVSHSWFLQHLSDNLKRKKNTYCFSISLILSTALISHSSMTLPLRCYFNWKPRNCVKSFMNISALCSLQFHYSRLYTDSKAEQILTN